MSPFEATYTCFLWPQAHTRHRFFFFSPPSKAHHCLSSHCLFAFFPPRGWAQLENSPPRELCWLSGIVSERPTCRGGVFCGAAAPHSFIVNVLFFLLMVFFSLPFCHVFLQVVGMDPHQRPLSRGDSAGEGQGSQPGGPEGSKSWPGVAKSLGRQLSGESVKLEYKTSDALLLIKIHRNSPFLIKM